MKPKILFVYDHKYQDKWMDGLFAALWYLRDQDFEIDKFNINNNDSGSFLGGYDFVLGWGAFGSRVDSTLQQTSTTKKGLCIAGNSFLPDGANKYDVLFYETDWIKENYLSGVKTKTVKAFGVNTDIYHPSDVPTPIVWDYIGVGSLSSWKRWERMAGKKGNRLVVGEYQKENEKESLGIARDLLINGVMVSDMVNPFDLSNYYQWSRTCYIPADINGGGERAVLEAKACGLQVEVEGDNPKLKELAYLKQVPSHIDYAKALKKGILSCL